LTDARKGGRGWNRGWRANQTRRALAATGPGRGSGSAQVWQRRRGRWPARRGAVVESAGAQRRVGAVRLDAGLQARQPIGGRLAPCDARFGPRDNA
jgi:hypothetical protein